MKVYDFSTLNDKEFENFVRDLLNAKFKWDLQSFKVGKDKGIDLRHSTSKNENSVVVQVKHYINTGYSKLISNIKKVELEKIRVLNHNRYIVVTSLSLSAAQKDRIFNTIHPFMKSSNDVIGREDLNKYLTLFPEIESRCFKLWFSSLIVYNTIINNAIEGRTKYLLQQIRSRIPFYVITNKVDEALEILEQQKMILITGMPGIGKTTLGEILLFELARRGFKIYKVFTMREAEDTISMNEEDKQVFYIDDFLGESYTEIMNTSQSSSHLTMFIDRIRSSPNKYIILTSRTVIVNQLERKSEKFAHSRLANEQFELKLIDYSLYQKAQILYNHFYFRGINKKYYEKILENKLYRTIIWHNSYTPRLVDFITDPRRINSFTAEEYFQFVMNNLNNPKEIWRYSFNNQISYIDRCLLVTLFTFERYSDEQELINAFQQRLLYEKTEHNQLTQLGDFRESIRVLLNGFINSFLKISNENSFRQFSLLNPSLVDFLIGYLSESYEERKAVVTSILYIEQLKRFDPDKQTIPLEKDLRLIIWKKISERTIIPINAISSNNYNASLIETLIKYCIDLNIDSTLLDCLRNLNFNEDWYEINEQILFVLFELDNHPRSYSFIKNQFFHFMNLVLPCINDLDVAEDIPYLFDKYSADLGCYLDKGGRTIIENLIRRILHSMETSILIYIRREVTSIVDAKELYYEIDAKAKSLASRLLLSYKSEFESGIEIDVNYLEPMIEFNKVEYNEWFIKTNINDFYSNSSRKRNKKIFFDQEIKEDQIDDLFLNFDI